MRKKSRFVNNQDLSNIVQYGTYLWLASQVLEQCDCYLARHTTRYQKPPKYCINNQDLSNIVSYNIAKYSLFS